MSYDAIKTGVTGIIEGLALAPSDAAFDFEQASTTEYGHTYILKPVAGDLSGEEADTLVDRVYDTQEWLLQVAFKRGKHLDATNLDEMHRKRDDLVKALDDPDNWTSFVRMMIVAGWEVEEFESYFVLNIVINITDTVTY